VPWNRPSPTRWLGTSNTAGGKNQAKKPNASQLRLFCRSELAREKLTGAAFTQETRVTVDVFREQARSYRRRCTLNWLALFVDQRLRNASNRAGRSSSGNRSCKASSFSSAALVSPARRRFTISCNPSSNEGTATGARLLSFTAD